MGFNSVFKVINIHIKFLIHVVLELIVNTKSFKVLVA